MPSFPYSNYPALVVALSGLMGGAGCGGDTSSGPEDAGVVVTTSASRSAVAPGQSVEITVRATPIGASTVRWITLVTSGPVVTRDSVTFNAPGPQEYSRTITLPSQPLTGTLSITGSASAGEQPVSDSRTVAVLDHLPPVILRFDALPGPAAPGDYIDFGFSVQDSVGVKRIRLAVDNSFRASDSIEFEVARRATNGTVRVRVPNDAVVGFSAIATLTVTDESQLSALAQFSVPIKDFRLPVATMTLGGLRADETIGTGDTIQITVNATDNHRLSYIGYAGAGVRDSVPASGLAASHTYRVLVLPAWRQQRPAFHVWARDVSGNLSTIVDGSARVLPVYDWVDHSVVSNFFPNEPFPLDVTWDAKRNVAYLLRSDPRGAGQNSQIEIMHLPSGTLGARIPVGGRPDGFSLTASGDSLIVILPDIRTLGIVNLTSAAKPVSMVPLQYDPADNTNLPQVDPNMRPHAGRAVGSHVFVPLVHGLFKAKLLDVNLATGVQTVRTDFGNSGQLTQYPVLFSLPDGRVVLNREDDHSNIETFVYSGTTNTFSPAGPLRAAGPEQFAGSPSGRFMLGSVVHDATMNAVDSVFTQDWKENHGVPAALSADGASAFLSTWYGYEKVRISDRFVLEQVKLSTQPLLLLALPDGNTLVAVAHRPGSNTGEFVLMAIDLR